MMCEIAPWKSTLITEPAAETSVVLTCSRRATGAVSSMVSPAVAVAVAEFVCCPCSTAFSARQAVKRVNVRIVNENIRKCFI